MRSFEERRAEIFSLALQKTEHKKKIRRRALAAGIPLLLCIIIASSLLLLPKTEWVSADKSAAPENSVEDSKNYDFSAEIIFADPQSDSVSIIKTDEEAKAISAFLEDALATDTVADNFGSSETVAAGGSKDENKKSPKQRKIIITDENGETAEYTLKGNILTSITAGRSVKLKANILDELAELLE